MNPGTVCLQLLEISETLELLKSAQNLLIYISSQNFLLLVMSNFWFYLISQMNDYTVALVVGHFYQLCLVTVILTCSRPIFCCCKAHRSNCLVALCKNEKENEKEKKYCDQT